MTDKNFKCTQNNALQCEASARIKNVLRLSMHFHHMNAQEVVNDILTKYNDDAHSKLLQDFNHIKYYHGVDTTDEKFDEMFDYLTDKNVVICDIKAKNDKKHDSKTDQNSD
eukprot:270574_1